MLEKPSFDELAEQRAAYEGMTGFVQPLPTSTLERKFFQIEQERATDEGMPEPTTTMFPGVMVRLR